MDEINKSSDNANEDACKKLNRKSCKVMNQNYNNCVKKKVKKDCPAGEEPDTNKCNTDETMSCKACPDCDTD